MSFSKPEGSFSSNFQLEYHRNTAADFVQIYGMFSRVILMKYHLFFGGKNRNSYGILWYFDKIFVVFSRIWVVFCWNFSGILMEFQAKKAMQKVLLAEFNRYFAEFFMFFLILLYPKRAWKKLCTVGT